jgi:hypothetical protein
MLLSLHFVRCQFCRTKHAYGEPHVCVRRGIGAWDYQELAWTIGTVPNLVITSRAHTVPVLYWVLSEMSDRIIGKCVTLMEDVLGVDVFHADQDRCQHTSAAPPTITHSRTKRPKSM